MIVGQIIRGVMYGELEYRGEEGYESEPQPLYSTRFPDLDTLDYSIYFKTDHKIIYVTWDSTFISYGLSLKLIGLSESTKPYEHQWDVSDDPKWRNLVGQRIREFRIYWNEVCSSELDGKNKIYTTYPQSFIITTEKGDHIIISAAELKQDENEVFGLMDNLLITTNIDLARQLKLVE